MITLSNGFSFEYVTASGALGYDGRGWPWEWPLRWLGLIDPSFFLNVMKTVTLPPRKGNLRWWKPWDCIRLMPHGAVNAVGLTNPGPDWLAEKIGPKVNSKKIPLVGELQEMTDDACKYSKTCPWRGEPPAESCIADPAVPCTAPLD